MSTIYICNRCGEMMNNIYTRFTVNSFKGNLENGDRGFDICEECHEEFEKFMKSSTVKLRPWSEVGAPPKINGQPLSANDDSDSDEEASRYSTDADDTLSEAKYKIGSYIQSVIVKDNIYKIMDIRLRDDGEFVYKVEDSSAGIQNLIWERVIDNWYTVIVKYSCDGCKLEGTDDCMCDTCIVGDPKGPRRQWWKPKEED